MMDGLKISIPQRMMFLRITLIISLVISLLLSFNLWGATRDFPTAPLVNRDSVPLSLDFVLAGLVILCWIASTVLNKQRLFIFLALVISIVLVLFDVNRLQPWFYFYNIMLAVFLFYNGRVDDSNKYTSYFIILQIVFASVYFFCGLSQLNTSFVESEFPAIIAPLRNMLSERQFLFFTKMGLIVPYMQMFIGIGLIISGIRYLAITLALSMHFVLLIFLFPSANSSNYALWFSNLSFMLMLLLMFSGKTKQRYFSPTFLLQIPYFYLVACLFIVLPFFNNSGLWPDYLSSNFKSGNNKSAQISMSQNVADRLPNDLKKYCVPKYTFLVFEYEKWSLDQMNVSCYPGQPVFNSIYNYLKLKNGGDVKEIELQAVPKQKLLFKP
jgi:hypothetical protein